MPASGSFIESAHPLFTRHIDLITALAARERLASISDWATWPRSGGLVSYGPVPSEMSIQWADCVDKILRGAKPADVPVQQATKFELVINLKVAKTLSLTIPPSLLLRTDEVIRQ